MIVKGTALLKPGFHLCLKGAWDMSKVPVTCFHLYFEPSTIENMRHRHLRHISGTLLGSSGNQALGNHRENTVCPGPVVTYPVEGANFVDTVPEPQHDHQPQAQVERPDSQKQDVKIGTKPLLLSDGVSETRYALMEDMSIHKYWYRGYPATEVEI